MRAYRQSSGKKAELVRRLAGWRQIGGRAVVAPVDSDLQRGSRRYPRLAAPTRSSRFEPPSSTCAALSDPETPTPHEESESTGGLGALLSTTPRILGGITALILAVGSLVAGLNKAGILGDGGGNDGPTTPTVPQGAKSLFAAGPRANGDVRFDDTGKMSVTATKPRHSMRVLADPAKSLQDVELTTRAKWESGTNAWGFALVCRQEDTRNYYLLGVTSDGRYNIAKYRDGKLSSLTGGLQPSDAIGSNENRIRARCIGLRPTTLTLSVNGEVVASKSDFKDVNASGNVGLRVGSDDGVVTCSFEDFVLTPVSQ
jgi:hypothetical protein